MTEPERFSKEHRRRERARLARLGRLPGPFQGFADRGRGHAALVWVLQGLLVLAVALPAMRLVTGEWLPRYAAVVVLALALALQSACRKVNLRAEQRAAP